MSTTTASTEKTHRATTGTFTATVDGEPNFDAKSVSVALHSSIEINGIQDSFDSPIRTISIGLDPDIKNGDYVFNEDNEVHQMQVVASSGSSLYVTLAATLHVDFDSTKERYAGRANIEAADIFNGGRIINVESAFNLLGVTTFKKQKK
jgi:hypothetical protein